LQGFIQEQTYSDDMQWGMVWESQEFGLKYSDIVANLDVDAMTAWRVV